VELIVFPETFLPYYPYFSFVEPPVRMGSSHLQLYEQAVSIPGAEISQVCAAAQRHRLHVLLGVNERDGGSLYNTQLLIDDTGSLVLKRRKITPTYHERMVWGQGDGAGLQVVPTALGADRCTGLLGALQPPGPLCSDESGGGDPLCPVPGFAGGPDLLGADRRDHAPSRPGGRLFVVCATAWLDPADHRRHSPPDSFPAAGRSRGAVTQR